MTQISSTANAQQNNNRWLEYYKATSNRPPRPILLVGLSHLNKAGEAYDIGCGNGIEALYLAKKGWEVHAVDEQAIALEFLQKKSRNNKNIIVNREKIENLKFNKCDLIYGGFAFPFCNPKKFNSFWSKMIKALNPGGILCGNLFGNTDSWANNPKMTFHSNKQLEKLFKPLEILYFDQIIEKSTDALNKPKTWHYYDFVLRKK